MTSTLIKAAVYAETCPQCGKANHFDEGDPTDITGVDIEGLECWNCKHRFLIDGVDWVTVEDANIEKGRKQ